MNAIIQPFQNELTPEERHLFEARAAQAGQRPGVHLKCILFGKKSARLRSPRPGVKPLIAEARRGKARPRTARLKA